MLFSKMNLIPSRINSFENIEFKVLGYFILYIIQYRGAMNNTHGGLLVILKLYVRVEYLLQCSCRISTSITIKTNNEFSLFVICKNSILEATYYSTSKQMDSVDHHAVIQYLEH